MKRKLKELRKEILENPTDLDKLKEYMRLSGLAKLPTNLTHDVMKLYKDNFGFINEEGKRVFIIYSRIGGTCVTTAYNVYVREEENCVAHFNLVIYHDEKRILLEKDYEKTVKYDYLVKQVTKYYYVNKKVE